MTPRNMWFGIRSTSSGIVYLEAGAPGQGILMDGGVRLFKVYFMLHFMLMLLSVSGICTKAAAGQPFLSVRFFLYWLMGIGLMGAYAVGWQQAMKRLPLTVAYANKAVTVVWGILWGSIFFNEPITAGKLAGSLLVILGVVCYAAGEGKDG